MAAARGLRLIVAGLLLALARGVPSPSGGGHGHPHGQCPPLERGDFTVHRYQLYPENAAWDWKHCLVYYSALFNGSIAPYDPYRDKFLDVISFPGITELPDEHGSGVDWNPKSGLLSVVIDAQNAFLTNGADVSGDYWLIKYDPEARRELWRANLTSATRGKFGGFQDVATDDKDVSFVVGTYPKSILRVDGTGHKIDVWYPPQTTNTSVHGYTGIARKDDFLLVIDNNDVPEEDSTGRSEIYRFDMTEDHGAPVLVPRSPNLPLGVSDAIDLPLKYGGTVMLVAEDNVGVTVLRSRDGKWWSAEHLGTIRSDFPVSLQAIIPATVQIGQGQYMIGEYFPGTIVPGTKAGNRSDFPMIDITAQVEALLA